MASRSLTKSLEELVFENADRYQTMVSKFKPEPDRKATVETAPNLDMIIGARIRPLSEEEQSLGLYKGVFPRAEKPGTVDIHELKQAVRAKYPMLKSSNYTVDRTFDAQSTTEDIYKDVVEPLVPWAWGGGIGTLFAYGQTGSGKTFTVSALEKLVIQSLMSGELEGDRKLYISIIELAGNSAHDLLNSRRQISILEDSFGVTQLAGALEHSVASPEEVFGYIESAALFRRTETTEKNDSSSRSHAICRIRIEIPSLLDAEDGILYLVDLAGSEAARDRAQHGADRMRETREINASLSTLKDCIRGKAEADAVVGSLSKKKPHVPFRQSALTKVLKHVFDPNGTRMCKTVVMACINPSLIDMSASRNTLRYAEMLRVLVPKAKAVRFSPTVPMTWSNEQLRAWIDSESGSPPVSSSILAPHETGPQLLRLPNPEFEFRCLKTDGVKPEQAKAFRSKLWQLHVDSQRSTTSKTKSQIEAESTDPDTILGHLHMMERKSSRDPDANARSVPFKSRIRPGMAVSWTRPRTYPIGLPDGVLIVVILCPIDGLGDHVKDLRGVSAKSPDAVMRNAADNAGEGKKAYLCAMVSPAVMPEAYEVSMWRHLVIEEDMMDAEVILEYDEATRYYYIAV